MHFTNTFKNELTTHCEDKCLELHAWVKVFRIIPEFRILRLTFHRSQPQNAELGRL